VVAGAAFSICSGDEGEGPAEVADVKLLLVCHNHPDLLVGGVEMYVKDLYEALSDSPGFEPMLLARAGAPFTSFDAYHADTQLAMANDDPNQYLLFTDLTDFDWFYGRLKSTKGTVLQDFRELLLAHRPDVVHFQHTAYMGYDMVRVARNALPDAPIVYSLHEYIPICHRDGVMVRTLNDELCREESPRRCHECFPEIDSHTFYIRKRFIRSHLSLADCFIAPSEYVAERYAEWGLERSKIVVKASHRQPIRLGGEELERSEPTRERNRFAYFGQLNPYKGADVLLRAMDELGEDFDGELSLYGANLEKQSPRFRERFEALLDLDRENVRFVGDYERVELPKLMAGSAWVVVPSIWWETGPIVVWEAFQHGRPVICSDIGGMSEKVTDGVNGLHFRTGDAHDLAETMRRAAETPGLWEELRSGVPREPGHSIEEDVAIMTAIYKGLLERDGRTGTELALEEVPSA
jgi:glycosyltransferase involved in cell wall biosynthesis